MTHHKTATAFATLVASTVAAGGAFAADAPIYAPPPPPQVSLTPPPTAQFNWSGPYLGVTGGYGWGTGTIENDGWLGGAYAGANMQLNSNVVLGIEGDFTFTDKSGTAGTTTVSNPWNSTLRARLGYAFNRTMVYGTGGVAFGRLEVDDTVGPTSEASTEIGWTAGVGVETAFTDNLTGRIEYRYTDLGSPSYTPGSISYSSHDVMVGIGFKF